MDRFGSPPAAFMKNKPSFISLQGQTRCALFAKVYGRQYNLSPDSAGVLEDAGPIVEGDSLTKSFVV